MCIVKNKNKIVKLFKNHFIFILKDYNFFFKLKKNLKLFKKVHVRNVCLVYLRCVYR